MTKITKIHTKSFFTKLYEKASSIKSMICLIAIFFFSCSFQSVPSTIFDLKESNQILYKPSKAST